MITFKKIGFKKISLTCLLIHIVLSVFDWLNYKYKISHLHTISFELQLNSVLYLPVTCILRYDSWFWNLSRTIFTKSDRHVYRDPDYMMTEEEGKIKHMHRDSYVMMLRDMRQRRMNRIKAKWVHLNLILHITYCIVLPWLWYCIPYTISKPLSPPQFLHTAY